MRRQYREYREFSILRSQHTFKDKGTWVLGKNRYRIQFPYETQRGLWWRDHFFGHVPTLNLSSEASNMTFFDRLEVFSNVIDLKNTLVAFVSGDIDTRRREWIMFFFDQKKT